MHKIKNKTKTNRYQILLFSAYILTLKHSTDKYANTVSFL